MVDQELTIRLTTETCVTRFQHGEPPPSAGQPDDGKVIKLASHQRWHMNPS
ncbi:hypothetical protein QJS66_02260 [Kocuria rhizophila]|nr:hypothetical protein QJS66_02260 [Kocuria rhizophila]